MSNLVIDPVLSGYNMAKVNENFQRISEIINNSLIHKDGANALTGDLDVNGKTLLNVGDIVVGGKSIFSGVNGIREEYENIVSNVGDLVNSLKNAMDEAISQGSVDMLHRNNAQVTWRLTAPYLNGETYTIPVYYTVGKNTIRLSYNGIITLYRGVDYEEVGDIGEHSNQIKMLRNIPVAAIVEAWVDGEDDMTQILETVNSSAELLSAYPPELLTNFISAVNEYNYNHLDESVAEAKVVSDTLANRTIVANEDLIQFNTYKNSIEQFYNQISTWYQQMSNLYTNLISIGEQDLDLANFEEALEGLATTLSGIEAQSQIVAQNMQSISDKYNTVVSKEASVSEKYDEIVEYTANALEYSSNAYVWAEGEDAEVAGQGGEHSSKEWALIASDAKELAEEYKNDASASANEAATSSELAGTYAQNAHDDYIAIQSVADSLEDAVEGAKQIVDQAEEIVEGALLKSGGQMSGDIYKSTNDTRLVVGGGTDSGDGAYVRLSGLNETGKEGQFVIHADGDNNYCELVGKADKTLKWGNDDVLTSASTLDASKLNVSYLPTAGGTMTGNITGVGASFTSLTVNGRDVTKLGGSKVLGEIVQSAIPLTDAGLHLLDGTKLMSGGAYDAFVQHINGLQATYPSLFCTQAEFDASVSAYGSCGKFVVSADGVRLPKVSDILQGTTDLSAVGDLVEAGLPNITGDAPTLFGGIEDSYPSEGALRATRVSPRNYSTASGTQNGWLSLDFDASRSSPYYRNDVQKPTPQTIKSLLYICVATSTKTPVEANIDNIATDLNGKADRDFANVTKPYIVEMGENSAGWWILYSNGWVEQGGNTTGSGSWGKKTVGLPIEMRDTSYNIYMTGLQSDGTWWTNSGGAYVSHVTTTGMYGDKTVTSFSAQGRWEMSWKVEGWKK